MVSIVDIGPAKGTVTIREQSIDIIGMTAADITALFQQFPELRRLVTGKASADVMGSLFAQFPHLTAKITAACVGKGGDQEFETAASLLTLGEQWIIIEGCLNLTFPQGPKNFLDSLLVLVGADPADVSGWAQATTSPAPSSDASVQEEAKTPAGEAPPSSSTLGAS